MKRLLIMASLAVCVLSLSAAVVSANTIIGFADSSLAGWWSDPAYVTFHATSDYNYVNVKGDDGGGSPINLSYAISDPQAWSAVTFDWRANGTGASATYAALSGVGWFNQIHFSITDPTAEWQTATLLMPGTAKPTGNVVFDIEKGFGTNYSVDVRNVTLVSAPSAVPEPGTILAALSILGPAGLAFRRRKA